MGRAGAALTGRAGGELTGLSARSLAVGGSGSSALPWPNSDRRMAVPPDWVLSRRVVRDE